MSDEQGERCSTCGQPKSGEVWMYGGHRTRVGCLRALRSALTAAEQTAASERARAEGAEAERDRLRTLINSPVVEDFFAAVPLEAAHQVERWGSEHDAGKTPFDWFWLLSYLAQKAADSAVRGDAEKAKHHTISSAAMLLNWHRQLAGESNAMRPGIAVPAGETDGL